MAEVDTIDVNDNGTVSRTVATASKIIKTIGLPTDAKSTATDVTSITHTQILKQISASVQAPPALAAGTNNIGDVDVLTVPTDPFGANADAASATGSISAKLRAIATALGVTALDLGTGTGGSRTLRFFKDTAQWIGGAGAVTSATQRVTLPSDDPAVAVLGTTADAASVSTSIKAALRAIATALGTTALDTGIGTGGSRTLRVAVDTSQAEGSEYEVVSASATDQVIGATGATGDYLSHVVVSPATAGCGVVTIKDNATTVISFAGGGTTALSNLIPFVIPVGITSTSGAWKITTGTNVSCVAVGNFT